MTSASETREALATRQREHRLKERVWPRERPAANADPWVLAEEALDYLDRVARELRPDGQAIADLEQAAEIVRQLAVGPAEDKRHQMRRVAGLTMCRPIIRFTIL
jgi:hypothetical protein